MSMKLLFVKYREHLGELILKEPSLDPVISNKFEYLLKVEDFLPPFVFVDGGKHLVNAAFDFFDRSVQPAEVLHDGLQVVSVYLSPSVFVVVLETCTQICHYRLRNELLGSLHLDCCGFFFLLVSKHCTAHNSNFA